MRTKTLIVVTLAVAAAPGLLIFALTRTSLYGAIEKALGAPTVIAIALLMLVVLVGAAVFSLLYGFGQDDPLRRERKERHGHGR